MELTREYAPKSIVWHVLMDWVENFKASIPKESLRDGSRALIALPDFSIKTFSQEVEEAEGAARRGMAEALRSLARRRRQGPDSLPRRGECRA